MILRIRIVNGDSVIQPWSCFTTPDDVSLSDTFMGIVSGRFSCGRELWRLTKISTESNFDRLFFKPTIFLPIRYTCVCFLK